MSLVDKIPPLISALAFGYGAGMAAPDSTLSSVQGAVTNITTPRYQAAPPPMGAPTWDGQVTITQAPPADLRGGTESAELSRLRQVPNADDRYGTGSCQHGPMYSHTGYPGYPPAAGYGPPGYGPPGYGANPYGMMGEPPDMEMLMPAGDEALSRLQLPDLQASISQQTLKYVKYFTTSSKGRGLFKSWLKRSGKFQDLIVEELRNRRLPEDLIWVAMIESGFDPKAVSPAGATGLWQFMPATGEVYGLRKTKYIDQRKNPRLATQAAVHHLRDLYMRFGHWDLALAAYNMGYEQLLYRIDRYGTADFNELVRHGALPKETSKYVPKIMAAAIVANNLDRFEFDDVPIDRPFDAAEVAVPGGTPLQVLAKAAGVNTSQIRAINADLLQDMVPPIRGDYLVMVPAETLPRVQATLPALIRTEKIQVDDAEFVDPGVLLSDSMPVFERRVPSENDSLLSLLPRWKPKDRGSMRNPVLDEIASNDDDEPARDDDASNRADRKVIMYRVGKGDTLIGVAKMFAVDVEDVAKDNNLAPSSMLREGALIKLRVHAEAVQGDANARPDAGPAKREVGASG